MAVSIIVLTFALALPVETLARLTSLVTLTIFSIVNLARHLDIDPEHALSKANHKFERRFREMEHEIRGSGRSPKDMSLADLEQEWRAAKRRIE